MPADHGDSQTSLHDHGSFHAGRVALVGRPNVGKSTMLNRLVGQDLAAVSRKPQTTRMTVRGIVNGPWYQLIVEDTPGLIDPRSPLDKALTRASRMAAASADLIVALVHPWASRMNEDIYLIGTIPGTAPVVAVINKIDLVPKPSLLPMMARLSSLARVVDTVPVSAIEGDGVDALIRVMAHHVPASPPLYPPEQLSDQPERFFVAEIVREGIMASYHEEVPYASAVEIEEYAERDNGLLYVRVVIWVERESQRAILVGKNGHALKRLGTQSRGSVERLVGRPVYLDLWVKVKPQWRDREDDLRRFGFTAAS